MDVTYARADRARSLDGVWGVRFLGGSVDLSDLALACGCDALVAAAAADAVDPAAGKEAAADPVTGPSAVAVPGCFDTLPGLEGVRGTAVFSTWFEQGDESRGLLAFGGVGVWAAVFVDDRLVHVHRKPYSSFEIMVPASERGQRRLAVLIDNRFDTERSPLQENYFDFYAYGGIFRPVSYTPLPEVAIRDVRVSTVALNPPTIAVAVSVESGWSVGSPSQRDGATTERRTRKLSQAVGGSDVGDQPAWDADVVFAVDGRPADATADVAAAGPNGTQTWQIELPQCGLWSPESPEVHELTVTLRGGSGGDGSPVTDEGRAAQGDDGGSGAGVGGAEVGGSELDRVTVRFGVRTIAVEGREILLNGQAIRLVGWNRHESHPNYGPALPHQQLVHDLRIMKDAGANFVRGSHYPQDERFLDLCDREGLLVWEESIGWQQEARHFASSEYVRLITEQQGEMIGAHFNHPSVIMWGFQNELHSELPEARPLLEALAQVTRDADPTRLVTFASCRFPHDRSLDLVDVVSLNMYPGWYAGDPDAYRPIDEISSRLDETAAELQRQGLADKPLIISEIGAGAIYGWRDPHDGPWSEAYQADYLWEVVSQFLDRPEIAGLALWQFCDCRTYGSAHALKRPRGFNNKGIVDEYRRPKDAYGVVRALLHGVRE